MQDTNLCCTLYKVETKTYTLYTTYYERDTTRFPYTFNYIFQLYLESLQFNQAQKYIQSQPVDEKCK